jgi:hypothetical protein
VADYRLYFLDRCGHILEATAFACADDVEAVAAAVEKAKGRRIELWQLRRRVFATEDARGPDQDSTESISGSSTP